MKEAENDYIRELRGFKKLLIFLTLTLIVVFVAISLILVNTISGRLNMFQQFDEEEISMDSEEEMAAPTPSTAPIAESDYIVHKDIYATMFWVGEDATEDNDYIPNYKSAWDVDWQDNFGGLDDPYRREGYYPADFVPRENPFYIALPYSDFDKGVLKESVNNIPWYISEVTDGISMLKNRWVRISKGGINCYAQWEDVGPFETDDFDYVFGDSKPTRNVGIDLSPAVFTCLGMKTNGYIEWQFVDGANVPNGPWKEIITTSQINW